MNDFLVKYFIEPTLNKSGYNIVNTIVYIAVLLVSLFVIQRVFKRLRVELNARMWVDMLPFVFLGGILRALEDVSFWDFLGVYSVLFVTPMIYFLVFSIAFASILVSKYLWKTFAWYAGLALAGVFFGIAITRMVSPYPIVLVSAVFAASYLAFYWLQKLIKPNVINSMNSPNSYVLSGQLLDASAAFISMSVIGGYFESSVGSSMIFASLPDLSFLAIKGVIALLAVYLIDRESKGDWNWIFKFAVMTLGLGPAIHNIFTLLMR